MMLVHCGGKRLICIDHSKLTIYILAMSAIALVFSCYLIFTKSFSIDVHLISVISISCIHNVFYYAPKAPYWMYFRSYKVVNNTNVAAWVFFFLLPFFYFKVSYKKVISSSLSNLFNYSCPILFYTPSIHFTHLNILSIRFSSASFAEHFVDYYTPICNRS